MLTTLEDLKTYRWIVEHSRYQPNYEAFIEEDRRIGDDGIAAPSGPLTPIQTLLQKLMHIEKTAYMLMDEPDEMESLFAVMHDLNLQAYRLLAESPAVATFTYEDTSTTVLSRAWYQDYCMPYLDQYADIVKAGGKTCIIHMCGKLKGFAREVGAGRMDGIDSLCQPTTGDFWPYEARACWADKIIIGGIEPSYMQRCGEEEMLRYTVDILNRMAPGRDFILCSGDAVSYGTPLVNLYHVTQLVEAYGGMPLQDGIDPDEAVKRFLHNC